MRYPKVGSRFRGNAVMIEKLFEAGEKAVAKPIQTTHTKPETEKQVEARLKRERKAAKRLKHAGPT